MQARAGSTHGYDVVDPTRVSRASSAARTAFRALARGRASAIVLDIVPNHMARRRREPVLARPRLRARFFDLDPRDRRHRRFFDIDELAGVRVEDPEVFEATHAQGARARRARASSTGCASTIPTGSPTRRGYLAAAARARASSTSGSRRSSSPASAARLAGGGHDRLRVPERRRRRCSSTRRGEEPLTGSTPS